MKIDIKKRYDHTVFGERMASGNRLSEVHHWLVEVGYCLMEGGCSLMKVAASNTVSVIHTATSTIRLLLTHQRIILLES